MPRGRPAFLGSDVLLGGFGRRPRDSIDGEYEFDAYDEEGYFYDDFFDDDLFGSSKSRRKRRRESMEDDLPRGWAGFTVSALKQFCAARGVRQTGTKAELIARLEKAEPGGPSGMCPVTAAIFRRFFDAAALLATPQHLPIRPPSWDEFPPEFPGDQEPLWPELEARCNGLERLLHARQVFSTGGRIPPAAVPVLTIRNPSDAAQSWRLPIPFTPEDVKLAEAAGEAAPFGLGTETKMDERIRRCTQLVPGKHVDIGGGDAEASPWELMLGDGATSETSSVLEQVRKHLAPTAGRVTARLHKVLVYGENSFFKPHTDTQRAADMFGTLVVEVPGRYRYYGGELVVRHRGEQVTFSHNDLRNVDAGLPWIAFFADCEHEVNRLTYGGRIVITFNLHRDGAAQPPSPKMQATASAAATPSETSHGFAAAIAELDAMLAPFPPDSPDGQSSAERLPTCIAYMLDHKYALSTVAREHLKGRDAEIFNAIAADGRFDAAVVPVEIVHMAVSGCGEEEDSDDAQDLFTHAETEARHVSTYIVDPTQPPRGGTRHRSHAVVSRRSLESLGVCFVQEQLRQHAKAQRVYRAVNPSGNEGTGAALLYIHAAMLVQRAARAKDLEKSEPVIEPPITPVKSQKERTPMKAQRSPKVPRLQPEKEEEATTQPDTETETKERAREVGRPGHNKTETGSNPLHPPVPRGTRCTYCEQPVLRGTGRPCQSVDGLSEEWYHDRCVLGATFVAEQ